jgi:IS30 family transposase
MSYTHLTPFERGKVELMLEANKNPTQIAKALGRARTTISREIARNKRPTGYKAELAQEDYKKRRKNCRPKSKLAFEPLRKEVLTLIGEEKLTPELAAGRLRREYPNDPKMQISHETVYQSIFRDEHMLGGLAEDLPRAGTKRRKRSARKKSKGPAIPDRVSIVERPLIVETRSDFGHWEGDLVVGKGQDGFILTLVERKSRLLRAVPVPTKHAELVCGAASEALLDFPRSWLKTLTFDNGKEFAAHKLITEQTGIRVFFAEPYSSYQRGSNEQVNGLIRRYLPKGTSFAELTAQRVEQIEHAINNRPRKCLEYQSPYEVSSNYREIVLRALGA